MFYPERLVDGFWKRWESCFLPDHVCFARETSANYFITYLLGIAK